MDSRVLIIIMVVLLVCVFFMQARSSKKNKKAQEEMRNQVVVGAEIMTIGGIIGKIVAMDNSKNTITIESGNSQIVFTSRAIHSVVNSPVAPVSIPEVAVEEKVEEVSVSEEENNASEEENK